MSIVVSTTTLSNGVAMPMEGFGVYQVTDAEQCRASVATALADGYRLIDTASAYLNEEAVGRAIRESGIPRDELFITTKLWIQDAGHDAARAAFDASLEKLGLDYLDLYLIHQPYGDYYGSWRAMEELYEAGRVRAIGVCNFYPDRLADLCLNARIRPMVNQVELHPFFQQASALEAMRQYGVQPEAWGPLAEASQGIFENPVLAGIASAHGKTVAQVVLRWNVQRGVVVIPKSVHAERIAENLAIWDFELTPSEMEAISGLDAGASRIIDHSSAQTAAWLNGFKIHD